jgi:hypothetical protein
MTTWYVNSAATGTGAGTSWVNATTTIAAAITLSAAGDDFNIASTHSESNTAITLTFKGTAATPNRAFSCDTTNQPAQGTDQLAGATVSTTTGNITISGVCYLYGITFNAGSSTGSNLINLCSGGASGQLVFDTCKLNLVGTGSAGKIALGTGNTPFSKVTLINTPCSFAAVGQGFSLSDTQLFWYDTPSAIGGTVPTTLIVAGTNNVMVLAGIKGCDLSAAGSGKTLVNLSTLMGYFSMENCAFGASVTPAVAPTTTAGCYVDYVNCANGATPLNGRITYSGTMSTETTVVRSATGAGNSWKIATTSNAKRTYPFESFAIKINCVAGTPVTVYGNSITDLNSDAIALTNADLWIEAQVMDNSGNPISDLYTTAPANQLTAGSTLTSGASSGSWTTTGMTTPDARQQSLTFTPQISGYVSVVYKVARQALLTLRVDPWIVA